MNSVEYLSKVGGVINKAKVLANQYYNLTGRPLGITGEVAEYEAMRILNLDSSVARQAGYDATKKKKVKGKVVEIKYQIKGRTLQENSKPGQKLSAIKIDKEWDYVLLVILNNSFAPLIIYEADREDIVEILTKPGSKARNERGQISVSKFKSIARVIWQSE